MSPNSRPDLTPVPIDMGKGLTVLVASVSHAADVLHEWPHARDSEWRRAVRVCLAILEGRSDDKEAMTRALTALAVATDTLRLNRARPLTKL